MFSPPSDRPVLRVRWCPPRVTNQKLAALSKQHVHCENSIPSGATCRALHHLHPVAGRRRFLYWEINTSTWYEWQFNALNEIILLTSPRRKLAWF